MWRVAINDRWGSYSYAGRRTLTASGALRWALRTAKRRKLKPIRYEKDTYRHVLILEAEKDDGLSDWVDL